MFLSRGDRDLGVQTPKARGHVPRPSGVSPGVISLRCTKSYFLSVELTPHDENIHRDALEAWGGCQATATSRASPFQKLILHRRPKHSETFEVVLQYDL